VTSSVLICSSRTITPPRFRVFSAMISIGVDASTHLAPCNAAAARLAMMPLQPVHSHAATAFT